MSRCRIYFFTYKRNHLLARSIGSLLNQTYTDWVCEVHNDCPGDSFPEEYISSLNDSRFIVHNHPVNLGPTVAFNLAFTGCHEEYASILEDDNWWEPTFLQEMIKLMDEDAKVQVAWSNMRLWKELNPNQWEDTGETTWPFQLNTTYFDWSDRRQAMGALHSNGAMMYRSNNAPKYIVPEETLFNAVELVRERSFEHPICLINKPLANFAITNSTYRSADKWTWLASQLMMLASYVSKASNPHDTFEQSLAYARTQRPSPVSNFLLVNLFLLKDASLLRYFTLSDWATCVKWLAKNVYQINRLKRHLAAQKEVYNFLLHHTANRYHEAIQ